MRNKRHQHCNNWAVRLTVVNILTGCFYLTRIFFDAEKFPKSQEKKISLVFTVEHSEILYDNTFSQCKENKFSIF